MFESGKKGRQGVVIAAQAFRERGKTDLFAEIHVCFQPLPHAVMMIVKRERRILRSAVEVQISDSSVPQIMEMFQKERHIVIIIGHDCSSVRAGDPVQGDIGNFACVQLFDQILPPDVDHECARHFPGRQTVGFLIFDRVSEIIEAESIVQQLFAAAVHAERDIRPV